MIHLLFLDNKSQNKEDDEKQSESETAMKSQRLDEVGKPATEIQRKFSEIRKSASINVFPTRKRK
jgi:hypothetical protein